MAFNQPPQRKFWTAGKKIGIAIVVLIVIGIAVAGVAMNMPFLKEGSTIFIGFQQEMYLNGDNNTVVPNSNGIMFPSMTLTCQTNNTCAVIFASISDKVVEVRMKMAAPANDKVWTPTGNQNTLKTIDPYQIYYVKVSADCTLQLKSCLHT
jgi:hypothetical protein